jgi:hypothetical protein
MLTVRRGGDLAARRACLAVLSCALVATATLAGAQVAAARTPSRIATVVQVPGCVPIHPPRFVQDTAGVARGFSPLRCAQRDGIWYLSGSAGTWRSTRTPWSGYVLAVAWDQTGTYALMRQQNRITLAKRTAAGRYLAPRLLGTLRAGFDADFGTLVARAGKWWAVWTEAKLSDVGGPFRKDADLFQARTLGRQVGRTRITTNKADDSTPHLLLGPAAGATPVLYWSRHRTGAMVARIGADGRWHSAVHERRAVAVTDARVAGRVTYLTWAAFDAAAGRFRIMASDNASGRFKSVALGSAGSPAAHIGLSRGRYFVAWLEADPPGLDPPRSVVAVRTGATWASSFVLEWDVDGGHSFESSAVVPRNGKVAVILIFGPRLISAFDP